MENELHWRDLSPDEVQDLANNEHQARVEASSVLGKIAFSSNPLDDARKWNLDNRDGWNILLVNENDAQMWLENKALEQGLVPAAAEVPLRIEHVAW